MSGISVALQGKINAIDEGLDLAIVQRPAEIHWPGGADEVGTKIVLAVRIHGARGRQQQCAGFQRAAADFDAPLR
ncbi:hypothetical protein D3C80_1720870 [compost metagenome]